MDTDFKLATPVYCSMELILWRFLSLFFFGLYRYYPQCSTNKCAVSSESTHSME
ncbi:hypothetical protein BDV35DRAFT_346267 [Aspergillus flavus]|uniref:Uncharacterized protein n=1 Tax=Aspergillus flavus TaxID=5059 RepID=A0A5N6H2U4_ASPFL|nr:hypothetical protein BDV35DRAFT_346267 [Aspergillus flavus]